MVVVVVLVVDEVVELMTVVVGASLTVLVQPTTKSPNAILIQKSQKLVVFVRLVSKILFAPEYYIIIFMCYN